MASLKKKKIWEVNVLGNYTTNVFVCSFLQVGYIFNEANFLTYIWLILSLVSYGRAP
jgi:hypothetical protein